MNPKKSATFIKNAVLFLAGSVFSKLLSFILLPLYTTYIPTADFGAYDVATLYVSLISGVVYFEIWSAMLRYMYDFEDDKKMSVVKSSLKIFGISTAVFVGASWVVCMIADIAYSAYVIMWGIATALSTYLSFLARGLGKNIDFALSGIINTATCLGMNILLVVVFRMNFSALYIGSIVGALAQTGYLLLRLKVVPQIMKVKSDSNLTKEIFRYAFPLCFNTAAYWVLNSSARLIYNALCGDAASGIFSVGNKFGTIIVLATTCFTYAWQDMSFSASNTADSTKLYTQASKKYLLFLGSCLCVALPALRLVFPFLVKGDYTEAVVYIPLFLIVAVISGYSSFIGNIFYAIKNTKVISASTVVSGIVTVSCAVPYIKLLGANGTNVAILTGFALNVIIRFVLLKRIINFKIPVGEVVFITLWTLATSLVYIKADTLISCLLFSLNAVIMIIAFRRDIKAFLKKLKLIK